MKALSIHFVTLPVETEDISFSILDIKRDWQSYYGGMSVRILKLRHTQSTLCSVAATVQSTS